VMAGNGREEKGQVGDAGFNLRWVKAGNWARGLQVFAVLPLVD
jgi:hypothetical protein